MATIISNRLRETLCARMRENLAPDDADELDPLAKAADDSAQDAPSEARTGEKQTTSSPTCGDPLGEPEVVDLMPELFASDASPNDMPDDAPAEPTARRGRPRILDDKLKGVIAGMLVLGISRRTAAKYVGCHHQTISNEAKRDPLFARDMQQAEIQSRTIPLTKIYAAAESNWRAAAWLVQREERRRAQKPAAKRAS
jgi:hypothetical protein